MAAPRREPAFGSGIRARNGSLTLSGPVLLEPFRHAQGGLLGLGVVGVDLKHDADRCALNSGPAAMHLFSVVDRPEEAVAAIDAFYSRYMLKPNF